MTDDQNVSAKNIPTAVPTAVPAAVPVAVLGLGLMGRALAAAFLRAGHPTTVWNRTPGKDAGLADGGARPAASPEEAVAAAELVVLCVSDHAAVRELLDRLDAAGPGLLSGRVLVDLTSGTAASARANAERVAATGGGYLDGVILAVPPAIGTPEAVVLYGGAHADFERYAQVLRRLAPDGTTHLGEDHGLPALHDSAVLALMWSVLNGFLHGAALLGAAGVDAKAFAPLAARSTVTVAGWLAGYADQIDAGAYPAEDAALGTHIAAMDHLAEESAALGVSTELPAFIRALAGRALAAGRGGESYAALVEQFRGPAPSAGPGGGE
ncbi:NAD(P)-binding domain-containing protein [Kitasatospora sp. NPDC004723]|uniref:NAD(P)-dependent oxidoreductase n=1 Tax=Kitasatospora sp. NPDC004723 TaxID=3154288 RepID=UPI0033A3F082